MSRILCIDPGSKPAYTVSVNGVIMDVTLTHPGGHFDVAVVEGQYWEGKKADGTNNKSPVGMMALSFTAGYQLGSTDADYYCVMKPQQWKPQLFRNGIQLKKQVFCRRVYRRLLNDRLRAIVDTFSPKRQEDALDSLGISLAYAKTPEEDLVFIKKIG